MKKILIIILFLLLTGLPITSEEISYYQFKTQMWDPGTGMFEMPLKFTYVPDKDLINLYYQSDHVKVVLLFFPEQKEKMLNFIQTFEKWEITAIDKKVNLIKKIGRINLPIYFQYAGTWHRGSNIVADIIFFSLSSTRHQILIKPSRTGSEYSRYHALRPNIIHLHAHEVTELKNALTKSFLDTRLKEVENQQQELDDLYNMF